MPSVLHPATRASYIVLDERGVALSVHPTREGRLQRSILLMDSSAFTAFKTQGYAEKAIRSTAAYAAAEQLPWAADIPKWQIVPVQLTRV